MAWLDLIDSHLGKCELEYFEEICLRSRQIHSYLCTSSIGSVRFEYEIRHDNEHDACLCLRYLQARSFRYLQSTGQKHVARASISPIVHAAFCSFLFLVLFQLLGELLLDRYNFSVMTKFISNTDNLKQQMNLLKEKSKNIQFEAFHVFKVFCSFPRSLFFSLAEQRS